MPVMAKVSAIPTVSKVSQSGAFGGGKLPTAYSYGQPASPTRLRQVLRRFSVPPVNSMPQGDQSIAVHTQRVQICRRASLLGISMAGVLASGVLNTPGATAADTGPTGGEGPYFVDDPNPDAPSRPGGLAVATFAGGCFWCMEGPFDKVDGVVATTSGYTGGKTSNPTYEAVSGGFTGHAESMEVLYDPSKVTYAQLLDVYWHQVNPTTANQQFCDRGSQYRSAIFPANQGQMDLAEKSLQQYQESGKFGKGVKLVTQVMPLGPFWRAEEYHQIWGDEAQVEEPASVIPPPQLLLKYGGVLGAAWLGGGLVARAARGLRASKSE